MVDVDVGVDHKRLSIVVTVFLVVAALSGGATVAVLSDRATVTTIIEFTNSAAGNTPTEGGNVPVLVTANVDEPVGNAATGPATSDTDTDTATTANASGAGDATASATTASGTGISISIEPAHRTIDAGSETTYTVVVTGATDGIGAYDLTVTLSNASVARFETFTHAHDPDARIQDVSDGEIDVSAGLARQNTINGSERIVLGTITVAGTAGGQADVTLARGPDGSLESSVVNGELPDPDRYDVNATHNGTITVEGGTTVPE